MRLVLNSTCNKTKFNATSSVVSLTADIYSTLNEYFGVLWSLSDTARSDQVYWTLPVKLLMFWRKQCGLGL